ncbi:hypothetical protein V6Z12_D05G099900 [Gossypium hirsutum]
MKRSGFNLLISFKTMFLGLFNMTESSGRFLSLYIQLTTSNSSFSMFSSSARMVSHLFAMALNSNGTLTFSQYLLKRPPVASILSAGRKPGWGKSIPVMRSLGCPPDLV